MMAAVWAPDGGGRWLKRFDRGGSPGVMLFCFHHAGGTAAMFREWPHMMPRSIEPVAVQLPGRADRYLEPPLDAMPPLVEALVDAIRPLLDQPFAFYGLSMGARVALALTHRLRELALPVPCMLFPANAAPPQRGAGAAEPDARHDDLIGYLVELGGTPPEILSEPDLLASLLPTLRADLTLVDTYRFPDAPPLDVPIRAFAGRDDVEGAPDRMTGWRAETRGRFDLAVVPGGHFFDAAGERQVVQAITDDLLRALAGSAAGPAAGQSATEPPVHKSARTRVVS